MADKRGPAIPRYLQPNYDGMVDRDAPTLNRLSALRSVLLNLESFERTLVLAARSEGATWDVIGQYMSVTRQAAQKRYAPWETNE